MQVLVEKCSNAYVTVKIILVLHTLICQYLIFIFTTLACSLFGQHSSFNVLNVLQFNFINCFYFIYLQLTVTTNIEKIINIKIYYHLRRLMAKRWFKNKDVFITFTSLFS